MKDRETSAATQQENNTPQPAVDEAEQAEVPHGETARYERWKRGELTSSDVRHLRRMAMGAGKRVPKDYSLVARLTLERHTLAYRCKRRVVISLAVTAAALLFYFVVSMFPQLISDRYKHFSRFAQRIVGSVWSIFPFSVAEMGIYIGIAALLFALIFTTVRTAQHSRPASRWARLGSHLLLIVSMMLSMFLFTWAPNYRSAGLAYELGLEVRQRSSDTLAAALDEICVRLNDAADQLPRDADGSVKWGDFKTQTRNAQHAWENLAEAEPYFEGCKPLRVKPVTLSYQMSFLGLTGVFMPVTGEANVNRDFPDPGRIFTIAHETAHAMGCAAENEANFAAVLACRNGSSALARYSGALSEFVYCYNALCKVDLEKAYEKWYKLPQQAMDDLHERSAYWQHFEGKVQNAANAVNDGYLKVMSQPTGVRSYGEVVDLILADFVQRTGYTEQ